MLVKYRLLLPGAKATEVRLPDSIFFCGDKLSEEEKKRIATQFIQEKIFTPEYEGCIEVLSVG